MEWRWSKNQSVGNTESKESPRNKIYEFDKLKRENEQLKRLLEQCQTKLKHDKAGETSVPVELKSTAGNFYRHLESSLQRRNSTSSDTTSTTGTEEEKKTPLQPTKESPFYASGVQQSNKNAIFVCTTGLNKSKKKQKKKGKQTMKQAGDELDDEFDEFDEFGQGVGDEVSDDGSGDDDEEVYVAVMDVNDDEWWEIVDPSAEDMNPTTPADDNEDEGFVVLDDVDVTTAMSDFIHTAVSKFPETQALSPEQMKKMLEGTFSTLQEKGSLSKAWEWGSFAYTTYGWGSYAWYLYSDPTMVRIVAKGVMSAAGYLAFFLI